MDEPSVNYNNSRSLRSGDGKGSIGAAGAKSQYMNGESIMPLCQANWDCLRISVIEAFTSACDHPQFHYQSPANVAIPIGPSQIQ